MEFDWDYDLSTKGDGFLTAYLPGYNREIADCVYRFDINNIENMLNRFQPAMLGHYDKDEDRHLIGMNSNSFTGINILGDCPTGHPASYLRRDLENIRHNIFMEWDKEKGKSDPPKEIMDDPTFLISETSRGFHVIKEAKLTINELLEVQEKYKCCGGFSKYTSLRNWAVLRISPKAIGDKIKIINKPDGFLYDVYQAIVKICALCIEEGVKDGDIANWA